MNSPRPRNLTDLTRIGRRHLPALILPVLVFSVAAVAALRLIPGEYRSSAILLPLQRTTQAPSETARLLTTVRQELTDPVRIEKLIASVDLNREARERGIHQDSLVTQIRDRIAVTSDSSDQGEEAITVSYRASDPETAFRVTTNLVEQLVAEGAAAAEAKDSTEIDALRKRSLDLSAKLQEFEVRLSGPVLRDTQVASTNRGSQPSGEAWRAQMNLESLNDQLYKLGQQIADLNGRIATQKQIVDAQKKESALNNNPTYALLIGKRTELQGQRDNLINRQELTDKHPRVLVIIDQITAINNQIEEMRKQLAGTLSQTPEARELLGLEADRRRLQLELEVTSREVKRRTTNAHIRTQPPAPSPQRTAGSSRIAEEYQRLKQDYSEATAKLQNALSSTDAGLERVLRLQLLQPANLPTNTERPNALLIGLAAATVGLILGACLAFGFEGRRRQTVQNSDDVEYYTRLPLLAAIPKTTTEEDRRSIKSRSRRLLAVGVAIAIVATVALTRLLIITEVFALVSNR